jgi:hypothetical protein
MSNADVWRLQEAHLWSRPSRAKRIRIAMSAAFTPCHGRGGESMGWQGRGHAL